MTKRTSKRDVATVDSDCTLLVRGERNAEHKPKVFATNKHTRRSPLVLVGKMMLFGMLLIVPAFGASKQRKAEPNLHGNKQRCQNPSCGKWTKKNDIMATSCTENDKCGMQNKMLCYRCREKGKYVGKYSGRKCWMCHLLATGDGIGRKKRTFRKDFVPHLRQLRDDAYKLKNVMVKLERLEAVMYGQYEQLRQNPDSSFAEIMSRQPSTLSRRGSTSTTYSGLPTEPPMRGQFTGGNRRWDEQTQSWVRRRRRFLAAKSRRRRLMQRVERSKFLAARRRRRRLLLRVRDHSRRN